MTMGLPANPLGRSVDPSLRRPTRVRLTRSRLLLGLLGGLVVLAVVRVITGAQDLTSAGTLGATVNLALPIALAGLGGLWSERSGVVNIGLEGMMILGTWFGAQFAFISGSPWMGIVGGLVGGLIGGVVHAIATIVFGVDQIVSGVAINILGLGVGRYLSGVFFTGQAGGGPTQSPQVPTFHSLKLPGADSLFGGVEARHWLVVSDVAGLARAVLTSLNVFTILAIALVPVTWFVLWRTAFGLRLRACGENPTAAESLGVNVYRMRWIAALISGMFAGLAGAFLVNFTGIYREGQTGGRGYIGLAAMIFGNWRPGGLFAGATLFGYTDALQLRQGSTSVHALLLVLVVALAFAAVTAIRRRRPAAIVVPAGLAVLVAVLYATTSTLPSELVTYTPQIITLLVLALASQRLRMPAADGLPWRRGQRT